MERNINFENYCASPDFKTTIRKAWNFQKKKSKPLININKRSLEFSGKKNQN